MPSYKEAYDTIVVGAGPSGSTAARELARGGQKVLLIDKEKFPRNKICGGLVPVKALNELDFEIPSCYIHHKIKKISVYTHKLKGTTYESNQLLGITISRIDLDHHLLNRAIAEGVQFYENTKFYHVEQCQDVMKIFTSTGIYYCKQLIGSDGVFSKVKNYVHNPTKVDRYKMGFSLSANLAIRNEKIPLDFKLFHIPIGHSMGWAIPYQKSIHVGIGGPAWKRNTFIKFFKSYLQDLKTFYEFDIEAIKIQGAFLPAGGFKRKIKQNNIILIGDAASFVDPLTGEGIYYAIRSGKIAAQQILQRNLWDYERLCYEELYDPLRKGLVWSILGINKGCARIKPLRKILCISFSKIMGKHEQKHSKYLIQ
ncbi:geranylgeranyl reductase family protein [Clostridiaceae bacterium 35-E11]